MVEFRDVSNAKDGTVWEGYVLTRYKESIRIVIRHYQKGWILNSPDLRIDDVELPTDKGTGILTAKHLALRKCAIIAHDRADALARAYFGTGA